MGRVSSQTLSGTGNQKLSDWPQDRPLGRQLFGHLARPCREKLKGLGRTRAPSADRGNPGPLAVESIPPKRPSVNGHPYFRVPSVGVSVGVKPAVTARFRIQKVERETGIEPATSTLGRSRSAR